MDLPTEILIDIFQQSCDSEFDDIYLVKLGKQGHNATGCYMKPFGKVVSQLSKAWKQLALNSSKFWFTHIYGPVNKKHLELLEKSDYSDLDIVVPVRPTSFDNGKWLIDIISREVYRNRIRTIHVSRFDYSVGPFILESLQKDSWPRLRAFRFWSVELPTLPLPNVRFLDYAWSNKSLPFTNLLHCGVFCSTFHSTITSSPISMPKFLSPTSHSLRSLIVDIQSGDIEPTAIVLPTLTKLVIKADAYQVVNCLTVLRAHNLEELQIDTRDRIFRLLNPSQVHFPQLRRLAFVMQEHDFGLIIKYLSFDEAKITDLIMNFRPGPSQLLRSDRQIVFRNLVNLQFSTMSDKSRLQILEDLDFTNASGSVSVLCNSNLLKGLDFPLAKSIALESKSCVLDVSDHLNNQSSIGHIALPTCAFYFLNWNKIQKPLMNVKFMELSKCTQGVHCLLELFDVLRLTPNISTLIFRHHPPKISFNRLYSVPQVLGCIETVVFGLEQDRQPNSKYGISMLMNPAKEMVVKHRELGYPIKKVVMGKRPMDEDVEWFKQNVDQFVISSTGANQSLFRAFDWCYN